VQSFVQQYFNNYHWKGYGLGQYEQGPQHVINIHYQIPTNKIGLGYKSKIEYNSNKSMLELQLENLTYDESLYLYYSLESNDDNNSDKLVSTYSFNNNISINMVQIEQINSKDIESIFLVERNIAKAE